MWSVTKEQDILVCPAQCRGLLPELPAFSGGATDSSACLRPSIPPLPSHHRLCPSLAIAQETGEKRHCPHPSNTTATNTWKKNKPKTNQTKKHSHQQHLIATRIFIYKQTKGDSPTWIKKINLCTCCDPLMSLLVYSHCWNWGDHQDYSRSLNTSPKDRKLQKQLGDV